MSDSPKVGPVPAWLVVVMLLLGTVINLLFGDPTHAVIYSAAALACIGARAER